MVEIPIRLNCPEQSQKTTLIILNLISSIANIKFIITKENPEIIYGDTETECKLNIPYIEYEFADDEWRVFGGRSRLVLPGFIQPGSLLVKDNKLGIDIFSLAYNFLYVGLNDRTHAKWAPDKISTGLRHTYPFFNGFIDLFIDSLKASGILSESFQRQSPWPAQASFAVGVSHDLDIFKRRVFGSLNIMGRSLLGHGLPGGLAGSMTGLKDSVISAVTSAANPYFQFSKWQQQENSATYFIFTGTRKSPKDPTYKAETVARELAKHNIKLKEIALHNGIGTSGNIEELEQNRTYLASIFNREIYGIRPHYLDYDLPCFWQNAKSFRYSSSVGSDTIPGFSCGMNHPFFGFGFATGKNYKILEIPIGIMDCALFSITDKSLRERTIDEIIANCKSTHGLLVLDWHSRTAYSPDYPGWFDAYISILDKAEESGAYIAPLGEIDRYWRKHCESVCFS